MSPAKRKVKRHVSVVLFPLTDVNKNTMDHDIRSCPCKRLPLCLSSFTAAEYGDLNSLAKQGSAVVHRRDAAGYTPLHLAAQNGHVSATALLLQLGCSVDGGPGCGATPLHRASYSGAVGAMRILLEWNTPQCDLLAKDTSFGDGMSPLHKAVAGGRYLAVQLLLEALRGRFEHQSYSSESLLSLGLNAKDSLGRTPLELANELSKRQDTERKAVSRWDATAGGHADWNKCIDLLLLHAEGTDCDEYYKGDDVFINHVETTRLPKLPSHLARGNMCLDCGAAKGENCLTASWNQAFLSALGNSVDSSLKSQANSVSQKSMMDSRLDIESHENSSRLGKDLSSTPVLIHESTSSNQGSSNENGACCTTCFKLCISLHARDDGRLVCKSCKRRNKDKVTDQSISNAFPRQAEYAQLR